jgi:hypothetical protein
MKTNDMSTFANGLDPMGVWSDKPLLKDDIMTLRGLNVYPGTKLFTHAEEHTVAEWTAGAMHACSDFREFLKGFITAQELIDQDSVTNVGRLAYIDSLKTLL